MLTLSSSALSNTLQPRFLSSTSHATSPPTPKPIPLPTEEEDPLAESIARELRKLRGSTKVVSLDGNLQVMKPKTQATLEISCLAT